MRVSFRLALLLFAGALAACRDDPPPPAAAAPDPRLATARGAAEASLRERMRAASALQLRGVQVFAQAIPNTFAVCGRAGATAAANEPLLPWVAQVSFEAGTAQVTGFVLGSSGPEATRVFVELVDRCFEGGGPANGRTGPRPFPPMPTPMAATPSITPASAAPAAEVQASAAGTNAAAPQAAARTVVTSARSGANLRASPQGGAVLRVVPRSSTLQVFGEAPGGWYQVGQNGSAWGWLHSSVLEGPAR